MEVALGFDFLGVTFKSVGPRRGRQSEPGPGQSLLAFVWMKEELRVTEAKT